MFDVPRWPQHPFANRPAQMVEAKHFDGPPPFETWEIFSWPRPAQFLLYYRPSLDDEQLIRSILPRADMNNPPWLAIRAVLVGHGYSVDELREWSILDLLAALREKPWCRRADNLEIFPKGEAAVGDPFLVTLARALASRGNKSMNKVAQEICKIARKKNWETQLKAIERKRRKGVIRLKESDGKAAPTSADNAPG